MPAFNSHMGWREGFVILAPNPARFHAIVTGCSTATNSFPILAVRKYQCPRIVRCSIHFTQPMPVDADESTDDAIGDWCYRVAQG